MTTPILQKMEQRRLAKGNVALYNLLDREIRLDCRTAKMLTEQCQVSKQPDAAHKSNFMYSHEQKGNTEHCVTFFDRIVHKYTIL